MQTEYEDYEDYEEGGFNWMLVTVLLLAIAGFFSLAWYAYQTGSENQTQGDVLVIRADNAPVKEKPENPGGIEFPHQEKTIYNAIQAEQDEDSVTVSILPPAEEPREMPAAEPADEKVAALIQKAVADAQKKKQEEAAKPAPAPVPAPEPVKPAPKAAPVAAAEPEPVAPAQATTGARVQLGAFRSNVEAEKMWQKIERANKDVLGGKPHQVVRADLGAKGVFYRLRVAGFDNDETANKVCKTLSDRKQGCFVVR